MCNFYTKEPLQVISASYSILLLECLHSSFIVALTIIVIGEDNVVYIEEDNHPILYYAAGLMQHSLKP